MNNSQSKSGPVIQIFTDGACSGNPGPGGWGVILVTPNEQIVELGGSEKLTTNNRMEIAAVLNSLKYAKRILGEIEIFTDSTYVIRSMTQWIHSWVNRGWTSSDGKELANVDLWKELASESKNRKIHWRYIRGHAGIPGNERADQIAVAFSQGLSPKLYHGPKSEYSVQIDQIPSDTSLPVSSSSFKKSSGTKQAYSYLSLIGTKLLRHTNWPDCERHVRGQPNARYRKAMSATEELEIIQSWGFDLKDVKES